MDLSSIVQQDQLEEEKEDHKKNDTNENIT